MAKNTRPRADANSARPDADSTSKNSGTIDPSLALQFLRRLVYACSYLADLTFKLERLYRLKPGAIEEILTTLAQIRGYLAELESPACLCEFDEARLSEVRQGRGKT